MKYYALYGWGRACLSKLTVVRKCQEACKTAMALPLLCFNFRYPFLGGSISLMFYSIVRHLALSLSNFLVLIVGFAFGFFIMHDKKKTENFENPWKAMAKTLTMVLFLTQPFISCSKK